MKVVLCLCSRWSAPNRRGCDGPEVPRRAGGSRTCWAFGKGFLQKGLWEYALVIQVL